MKTILHQDNWVEVPAGEFIYGLSEEQREAIVMKLLTQADYDELDADKKQLLDRVAEKLSRSLNIHLDKEERAFLNKIDGFRGQINSIEERLRGTPPQTIIKLERFYIARFPITQDQFYGFQDGKEALTLRAVLEEPEFQVKKILGKEETVYGRLTAAVRPEDALAFIKALGGRLPKSLEWEKAARGTDGRLYPWGNEWDPEAGYFYRGQTEGKNGFGKAGSVTTFARGVSPYGVWAMAGGLPEMVTVQEPRPFLSLKTKYKGEPILIDIKGCHTKESSPATAWFDHILALPGYGMWMSLRPVLDEWPLQQWRGTTFDEQAQESPAN